MHAHKQTGLRKVGIADRDRTSPEHDLAVQYLSTPDVSRRLYTLVAGSAARCSDIIVVIPEMRLEGTRGGSAGFADVAIVGISEVRCVRIVVEVKTRPGYTGEAIRQITHYRGCECFRTAHRQAHDNIGRSLRHYEQVADVLILATVCPISQPDADMLGLQNIRHVYLGAGFEEWVSTVAANAAARSIEL